jgi:hypothetical protein
VNVDRLTESPTYSGSALEAASGDPLDLLPTLSTRQYLIAVAWVQGRDLRELAPVLRLSPTMLQQELRAVQAILGPRWETR